MSDKPIINQCCVCWVDNVHIHEITKCTRRGLRTYLLCDECYELYKDMERFVEGGINE